MVILVKLQSLPSFHELEANGLCSFIKSKFKNFFFFQGLKITFSDISTIKFLLYFSVYM